MNWIVTPASVHLSRSAEVQKRQKGPKIKKSKCFESWFTVSGLIFLPIMLHIGDTGEKTPFLRVFRGRSGPLPMRLNFFPQSPVCDVWPRPRRRSAPSEHPLAEFILQTSIWSLFIRWSFCLFRSTVTASQTDLHWLNLKTPEPLVSIYSTCLPVSLELLPACRPSCLCATLSLSVNEWRFSSYFSRLKS